MTSSALTGTSVVQRRPDALSADVGGELVLMSVDHGRYYGLDDIGSDIWEQTEQAISVRQLCDWLSAKYEGDPAVIERDVLHLLAELAAQDLIEAVEA